MSSELHLYIYNIYIYIKSKWIRYISYFVSSFIGLFSIKRDSILFDYLSVQRTSVTSRFGLFLLELPSFTGSYPITHAHTLVRVAKLKRLLIATLGDSLLDQLNLVSMLHQKTTLLLLNISGLSPLYLTLQIFHVALLLDPFGRSEGPGRENERSLNGREKMLNINQTQSSHKNRGTDR